jgi:hypothetical protein
MKQISIKTKHSNQQNRKRKQKELWLFVQTKRLFVQMKRLFVRTIAARKRRERCWFILARGATLHITQHNATHETMITASKKRNGTSQAFFLIKRGDHQYRDIISV